MAGVALLGRYCSAANLLLEHHLPWNGSGLEKCEPAQGSQ